MGEEQISGYIERLGLTKNQCKVLLTLLKFKELTGGMLAKYAGMHRPEVYRALKQLQQLGLIIVKRTHPVTFSSLPPEKALKLLLLHREDEFKSLERGVDEVLFQLKGFINVDSKIKPDIQETRILVLSSLKQVESFIVKLWTKANDEVNAMLDWIEIKRIPQTKLKEVIERKAKNIRARIIGEINSKNILEAKWFSKFCDLRCLTKLPVKRMVIADEVEMLITINISSGKERTTLLSGGEWVKVTKRFFEYPWLISKQFSKNI